MNVEFIRQRLRELGWNVVESSDADFALPASIAERFPRLPETLIRFLAGLQTCSDATETTWYLCKADYDGTSNSAFKWNEWETLSIESAGTDKTAISEIRKFWDEHFPFMLSVDSGYAFWAVRTSDSCFGQIVSGQEPEFEEVSIVAESFEEFLVGQIQSS